tara:strand:- start:1789 stop:2763 length:975 start_codon:yes stop_codon:yes gene_type:complete
MKSSIKERVTKKAHSDPRVTIDKIHNGMIDTMNEKDKDDYYLDNGFILSQYYSKELTQKQNPSSKTGILSYFDKKEEEPLEKECNVNIINQYMSNVDECYNCGITNYQLDKCKLCKQTMVYSLIDSELICNHCGYTEEIIINSERVSYKDPPREASYFAYKRMNHFNEWLAQFQAKETTEIPDKVYKGVYEEINKNINIDIKKITHKRMREILKNLEFNKYYEHIPHLINVLNGKKAPKLSNNEEEQLRNLFKEIQLPFSNNCPEDRKNFLSYSYVLHKFCELLEYDYLLLHFPLLKSREKLLQQDKIWKLICKDLNWQYIPSV